MKRLALLWVFTCLSFIAVPQTRPQILPDMEQLLGQGNYGAVDKLVKQRITVFLRDKNIDTISYYVFIPQKNGDPLFCGIKT